MDYFKGKKVYIFGGSSGIGLSAAKQLSGYGADVFLFSRGEEKLKTALNETASCCLDKEQCFSCTPLDVSDSGLVNRAMEKEVKNNGAPDILLNCAGRAIPKKFEDISFKQFDETMKINLYGIWNTCKALVPHMKSGSIIVNTSSMAGFIGPFGYTDYAASKFAILGFSEALRSELKPRGISVSVLCPPDTDTPGFAEENKTKPAETAAISANAKLLGPDDVAKCMIKAMLKNKAIIVCGFDGKTTLLAKRFMPGLVEYVMDRTIKKVQMKKV